MSRRPSEILSLAALVAASFFVAATARGDAAGPWLEEGDEINRVATAVRIIKSDEYIYDGPSSSAQRRGSAAREARLPFFGSRTGPGCRSKWYSVGPSAWVCGDSVELTRGKPVPADARTFEPSSDGLPYRYYFVGPSGSAGYKRLVEADIAEPSFNLEPGFAVAISEERVVEGHRYGLTGNQLWVPMRDLGATRSIAFQGSDVPDGTTDTMPLAWVTTQSARIFAAPSSARATGESLVEFTKVDAFEQAGQFEKFTRIADGKWLRSKDIARPTIAAPPDDVDLDAGERWIDVELATQTLIAYEGRKPVFSTIVSTGKGRVGSGNETPRGSHRIWVKLASTNMDNLEDENANRYYRIENVPYVQFFDKGVGIHGAFWHRGFGHVRSHGCVNLAPLDAQRLYWFTSPRLPAGWTAVLPTAREKGSIVRVR